jgi:hypothetical protein
VPVAIERSEGLLVEHLQANGHPVYPVSPRIAARARERSKVAAVKDDRTPTYSRTPCASSVNGGGRCHHRRRCWPRSRR